MRQIYEEVRRIVLQDEIITAEMVAQMNPSDQSMGVILSYLDERLKVGNSGRVPKEFAAKFKVQHGTRT